MNEIDRQELERLMAGDRRLVMTADVALAAIGQERRTRGRRALEQTLAGRGGAPIGATRYLVNRGGALEALTLCACSDLELEVLARRYRRQSVEALARAEWAASALASVPAPDSPTAVAGE